MKSYDQADSMQSTKSKYFVEVYKKKPYLCIFRECVRAYDGFGSSEERDDHVDDHMK